MGLMNLPAISHLLGQLYQCSLHGHPSGVDTGFPQSLGDGFIALAQFDTGHNRLAIFGAQLRQGGLVALNHFLPNRQGKRRCRVVGNVVLEFLLAGLAMRSTKFVSDPICDGLTEIGLKSTVVLRLKGLHVLQGAQHRVLHEILRVGQVSCPTGQASACPSFERAELTGHQLIECFRVACPCPREKLE